VICELAAMQSLRNFADGQECVGAGLFNLERLPEPPGMSIVRLFRMGKARCAGSHSAACKARIIFAAFSESLMIIHFKLLAPLMEL
jgi:hypothetical protein